MVTMIANAKLSDALIARGAAIDAVFESYLVVYELLKKLLAIVSVYKKTSSSNTLYQMYR